MAELAVPEAAWAEATVVGCAVATLRGAQLAAERVRPDQFYNPRLGRLFEVAVRLTVTDPEDRITAAAAATGIPVAEVTALVDDRAVEWDSTGSFARRVVDAARRRDVMSLCARIHRALGEGRPLADVFGEIRELEVAAAS